MKTFEVNRSELVLSCLAGKTHAQRRLFDQYKKGMYHICLNILRQEHDAQEALQLAFITVFNKLGDFRNESTLGAWIKRIVINTCIDQQRKTKKEIYTDHFFEEDENAYVHDSGIEEQEQNNYTVQKIKQAMSQLADGYRTILTLYLFEGYDHAEISTILGISENTSKSQYSRAKAKLKKLILDYDTMN